MDFYDIIDVYYPNYQKSLTEVFIWLSQLTQKPEITWNEESWQQFQSTIPQGTAALRPTVTVIIPTLNEAKNLPLILPYIPMDWVDEVLLVDGRSTDNTVEVARQLLPSITGHPGEDAG